LSAADEVELTPVDGGGACELAVRAQPGASRRGVAGVWQGHLRVAVHAPPEDGRANRELERALAKLLGLRTAEVSLVQGATARNKRFRLEAPAAIIRAAMEELLEP
jgi:uncharacterized protein (TIGR00251 family)